MTTTQTNGNTNDNSVQQPTSNISVNNTQPINNTPVDDLDTTIPSVPTQNKSNDLAPNMQKENINPADGYIDDNNAPKIEVKKADNPQLAKYKVLIIEDNSDVRFQYEFALKKVGFTVVTASNGEEGLVKAIKARPQLILLDILMPETDGWTVLRALREYTSTYRPKIVILSNLGAPEDVDKAYKYGADMFLIKASVTLLQVVDKVKEMLVREEKQPSVFMIPIDSTRPEFIQLLKNAPPDARNAKCPVDGSPLGLKLTSIIKTDEKTGKKTHEYIARFACLKCGKEIT